MKETPKFRIAVTSDSHIGQQVASGGREKIDVFEQIMREMIAQQPNLIIFCGDATDHGLLNEAQQVARVFFLSHQEGIPIVAVLGNNDHSRPNGENTAELKRIFQDAGVSVLDGQALLFDNVGVTGVEGYAEVCDSTERELNFRDRHAESGSTILRDDIVRLRSGLQALRGKSNIVVLHYPPATTAQELSTIEGEPEVLQQRLVLGSNSIGREIIDHNKISLHKIVRVYHGHLDNGSSGGLLGDIPVRNGSILAREKRQSPLFVVEEI